MTEGFRAVYCTPGSACGSRRCALFVRVQCSTRPDRQLLLQPLTFPTAAGRP